MQSSDATGWRVVSWALALLGILSLLGGLFMIGLNGEPLDGSATASTLDVGVPWTIASGGMIAAAVLALSFSAHTRALTLVALGLGLALAVFYVLYFELGVLDIGEPNPD